MSAPSATNVKALCGKSRTYGSVRGALSNERPYRNRQIGSGPGPLARDRGFADSPLEEAVTSEPVSEAKFPVTWENTGNFHRRALPSRKTVENRQAAPVTYEEIP
jgi:hypothetical protein